ncbi:MAG: porin [Geminicoccaceae bacterium]
MRPNHWWLGTVAASALLAGEAPAHAQQVPTVVPGGALDLTLTGFIRFRTTGGEFDDARLDDDLSRSVDFSNDTEFHVVARGKSEEYGFEYGGTIEFEADTDQTLNTDETWLFLRGAFGEFRLGDDDGVVDDNKIGGYTVAAGTGGIDGDEVDTIITGVVQPFVSDDSTKLTYYTPDFGGFRGGVSYTPNQARIDSGALNGNLLAFKNGPDAVEISNNVEGALVYEGDLAGVGVQASLIGNHGDYKHDNEGNTFGDDSDFYSYGGGAALDLFGLNVGAAAFHEKLGDFKQTVVNAGIGIGFGPLNTSVTAGYVVDADNQPGGVDYDHPYNIVASADVGIAPGLSLRGDVSYFDNSCSRSCREAAGYSGGDKGMMAIGALFLDF